jgi:hypothetical protein
VNRGSLLSMLYWDGMLRIPEESSCSTQENTEMALLMRRCCGGNIILSSSYVRVCYSRRNKFENFSEWI